ncbi:TELO2-interacting protein 1 [Pelomyxa schiedti]|nr:TELO2-interacting protein 1 [Pelomyxa schiedti]
MCLSDFANACELKDVPSLIAQNVDYILNNIQYHIHHIDSYPNTTLVFRGILNFAGAGFLPLLEDTLDSILKMLEEKSSLYTESFFRILHSVTSVIASEAKKNSPAPCSAQDEYPLDNLPSTSDNSTARDSSSTVDPDVARNFFEEHLRKQQEPSVDDCAPAYEMESEKSSRDPAQRQRIDYIGKILERCQHYLDFRVPAVRILVLEIIAKGIQALVNDRAPETCLATSKEVAIWPLLHVLWDPLVSRLFDSERPVIVKTIGVFSVISTLCQSVLASRFSQTVWPSLSNRIVPFLKTLPVDRTISQFDWNFKEMSAITDCLATISQNITISRKTVLDICHTFLPLLSQSCPEPLQQRAIELFLALGVHNGEKVWSFVSPMAGTTAALGPVPTPLVGFVCPPPQWFFSTSRDNNQYHPACSRLARKLAA